MPATRILVIEDDGDFRDALDGRGLYEEIRRDCPQALRRLVFMSALARSPEYASFLRETSVQLREVLARMVGPPRLGADPHPS